MKKTAPAIIKARAERFVSCCLSFLLLFSLLTSPVLSSEVVLSVQIPDSHSVLFDIDAGGFVEADGKLYSGTAEERYARFSSLSFIVLPEEGQQISEVICGGKDVTGELDDQVYTLGSLTSDIVFSVRFTSLSVSPSSDEEETDGTENSPENVIVVPLPDTDPDTGRDKGKKPDPNHPEAEGKQGSDEENEENAFPADEQSPENSSYPASATVRYYSDGTLLSPLTVTEKKQSDAQTLFPAVLPEYSEGYDRSKLYFEGWRNLEDGVIRPAGSTVSLSFDASENALSFSAVFARIVGEGLVYLESGERYYFPAGAWTVGEEGYLYGGDAVFSVNESGYYELRRV